MNQAQMMKQLQQMQAQMAKAQAELAASEVTGSAGGGLVSATVTGDGEVRAIKIDPKVVDPDDVEMLEDLVVAALTAARKAAADLQQEKLGGLTGGLNIPGF